MKVLVLAPHADDETLGVGGTIAKHVSEGDEVSVVVLTGEGQGDHPLFETKVFDIVRSEAKAACALLGTSLDFLNIPTVLVDNVPGWELNALIKGVLETYCPDVLYVPFAFDLHQDHRKIYHSASIAWRPISDFAKRIKAIYCYETLSETHWASPYLEASFIPNSFVDISDFLEQKVSALAEYKSQLKEGPHPRSIVAIKNLAGFRGGQVGVFAAEAFVLVRGIK